MTCPTVICHHAGCGRPIYAKGLCKSHRMQILRGFRVTKDLRPRGVESGPRFKRSTIIEECAVIAEYHDAHQVAEILRKLTGN